MTRSPPSLRIAGPKSFQQAFNVSRETLERLTAYAALLETWQRKINLVAPSTVPDIWHRHFADSAQVLALAPTDTRSWLDLGSGAGFPGLVAAILSADGPPNHDAIKFRLVESDSRKAAFLQEVARTVDVSVDILCERIEKIAIQDTFDSDVISARALAPLDRLLSLISPFFSVKSKAFLLKGRAVEQELEAAEKNWRFDHVLVPSLTERDARVVVITNLQAKPEV